MGSLLGGSMFQNRGHFFPETTRDGYIKGTHSMNSTYQWMVFYGKTMLPKNPSGQSDEKPNFREISSSTKELRAESMTSWRVCSTLVSSWGMFPMNYGHFPGWSQGPILSAWLLQVSQGPPSRCEQAGAGWGGNWGVADAWSTPVKCFRKTQQNLGEVLNQLKSSQFQTNSCCILDVFNFHEILVSLTPAVYDMPTCWCQADRMLDMGFEPQIRKILAKRPGEILRQHRDLQHIFPVQNWTFWIPKSDLRRHRA